MSVSYIPRARPRLSTTAMNTTFAQSPSKLALLSHHKLQQESSAEEPDLRRCLGHNAVLSKTMTAARRDFSRYRKTSSSSRFYEDDGVDGYINRKEDQGSVVRAQLAKAVRGWIRRRSMAADANAKITTTTAATTVATTPTATKAPTTTTTTPPNDNALARVAANNNRDTGNKWSIFSSLVSIKKRQCVARLVPGRKFWAQPVLMQASAG
ncbi:uncharacterized protein ACHE_31271A [Aspergillus chevalieri]|uniref:Uncharacterized protein n=1 Tax=Aspergillus chevalieri TaxID=182096 RepID=A0A7R7VMG9_ASPCH|nr:uncharacterized protein ACHE_31271A [Aspergillus chevalieri]BCR87284.1 hypothetical protein ACHE_31271A [Aspergillus chevalieri]